MRCGEVPICPNFVELHPTTRYEALIVRVENFETNVDVLSEIMGIPTLSRDSVLMLFAYEYIIALTC